MTKIRTRSSVEACPLPWSPSRSSTPSPRPKKLVAAAPHIETEADLLEGLQYLAGCVAACMHMVFDYERDHPMLLSGTGPFTKMGLDNPDTMYFGCRVQADHDYVVTGVRGTTTDLSFQLLGGEYTDDNVPASQAAFDDRELEIAADGSFQWQVRPDQPRPVGDPRGVRRLVGSGAARWRFQRLDTAGHRTAAADPRGDRKALQHSGKATCQPDQDLAAVPAVVLSRHPGQHHGGAAADARAVWRRSTPRSGISTCGPIRLWSSRCR